MSAPVRYGNPIRLLGGLMLLLLAVSACSPGGPAPPNRCTAPGQACPDSDKPYLFPGCPACVALIGAPRVTATQINPFGGRVPVAIEYCASVAADFPEQFEGMTLRWDVDGIPGFDVEVDADACFEFTYTECEQVQIRVQPVDNAFGLPGTSVTRLIRNTCNAPPVCADLSVALGNGGFPNGVPPLTVQAFATAFDPDFVSPDLASGNGIVSFEIDWEGDGTWDVQRPGNVQVLPLTHSYRVAGVYRPRMRAFDETGESCQLQKGRVTVFAPITFRDFLYVRGDVRGVVVPDPADPVTNVAFAWSEAGYGWLRQTAEGEPLRVVANDQIDGATLQDGVMLGQTLVAAHNEARMALLTLADAGALNPALPTRLTCDHTVLGASAITASVFGSGTTEAAVVVRRNADLFAYNAGALLAGVPTVCDPVTLPRNPVASATQTRTASGFGAGSFTAVDVAAMDRFAFVAALGSGGEAGVVAYDLSDAAATPTCVASGSGCLTTTAPARAVAVLPGRRSVSPVPTEGPNTGTETVHELPAYFDMAAPATLLVDGVAYAAAATTWWFAGPGTVAIANPGSITITSASVIQLNAVRESLLALGFEGGAIEVYAVGLTANPTYSLRSRGCCATAVDGLALDPRGLVLWSDRSTPYFVPGATAALRQKRAVYAAPLTQPGRWLHLLPPRLERRDLPMYTGPLDLARDSSGWWVADGAWGVYYLQPPPPGPAYAIAPATSPAYAIAEREVDLSAPIAQMLARADTQQVYVALGEAGVAALDFGTTNAPRLQWLTTTRDTVSGLALLQDALGNLLTLTGSDRVQLLDLATPLQVRSTYVAPPGMSVLRAQLHPDPEVGARGILYTLEATQDVDGTVYKVRLRGFGDAADLAAEPVRQLLLPDDTGGFTIPSPLPPVVGRLLPGGSENPRVLYSDIGSIDRLCIEKYWGGSCAANTFQSGFRGRPFRAGNNLNNPLIAFFDGQNTKYEFIDQDGGILNQGYALCGDLPTQDEELQCFTGHDINAAVAADPYWVLSTEYALYIVDLSNPVEPQLVTRSPSNFGQIAVWLAAPNIRIAQVMSDGRRVRLVSADNLLPTE